MKKTKKFLQVDYTLLSNPNFNPLEKLFISYLQGYQRNKKYCFETQEELALTFGVCLRTIATLISDLSEKKVIFKAPAFELGAKRQFKKRKGYVLVDNNNPLPQTHTETAIQSAPHNDTAVKQPSKSQILKWLNDYKSKDSTYNFGDIYEKVESGILTDYNEIIEYAKQFNKIEA